MDQKDHQHDKHKVGLVQNQVDKYARFDEYVLKEYFNIWIKIFKKK